MKTKESEQYSDTAKKIAGVLAAGAALGTTIGILVNSGKGKGVVKEVKDKVDDLKETAKDKMEELKEKTKDKVEDLKKTAKKVKGKVEELKKTTKKKGTPKSK